MDEKLEKTVQEIVAKYEHLKDALETTSSTEELVRILGWTEQEVRTGRQRLRVVEKYHESLHFLTVREINAVRSLGIETGRELLKALQRNPRLLLNGQRKMGLVSIRRIMGILGIPVPKAYQAK